MRSIIVLSALAVSLLAEHAMASGYKATSLNFAAPIIQNRSNLPGDTTFGTIIFDNSAGQFMGLDSAGNWQAFGGGANTALSNLASTAVNTDINPASNNSVALGSSSYRWSSLYATQGNFVGGKAKIEAAGGGAIMRAHAFGSPTTPRVLYFDTHEIDSNESATEIFLGNSDGADVVLFSSNFENGNGPGTIKTANHIRVFPEFAPSSAVQSSAGSTGTCTLSPGTDVAGKISITTDGSGISTGAVCDITFGYAYKAAPVCTLTAANATAGTNAQQSYVTTTTTKLTINFGASGASAATYDFHFHCLEVGSRYY